MKLWKVGIYVRVSTENEKQKESIPAQIKSLKDWLYKKEKEDNEFLYKLINVYVDEGYSGTNFNRRSFLNLKADIENNKLNMVLTRDLSRFSRNYIMAGYYIEDYFKEKGIRFVSVLDNVDTLEEVSDIVPFKNILNEMYVKDCSRRTRDGLKQRMIMGSSIASKPLYGYRFKETYEGNIKKIKLVPSNDETTEVVKLIYKFYIKGWGYNKIANYLNELKIPSPASRLKNFGKSKYYLWTNNSIKSILTNVKYCGIMLQGQNKKVSYKINKIEKLPKEQWINGGHFEGIISKETFYEVQELIKKRKKSFRYKKNNIHLFSGILKCGDCTGGMCYRKDYKGYKCTNSQRGGKICTAHSIKEKYLIEIIKKDIKGYTKNIDKDKFYEMVELKNSINNKTDICKIEKQLRNLDKYFSKLYMDRLNEKINERNFLNISKKIERQQQNLLCKKNLIENKLKEKVNNKEIYLKINNILNVEVINRNIIEMFINKIEVKEMENGEKIIQIYYKFKKD